MPRSLAASGPRRRDREPPAVPRNCTSAGPTGSLGGMAHEDVLYEVGNEGVATLTINRPEVMNALRPQTSREMLDVLADVRNNDDVRCLLLTGAGRGFCAGDDFQAIFLAEDRASRKNERQKNRIRHGETSLDEIFALEKPTVAAVNGPAVGYGMDIALYCDIRIASERAKFGWFFVRRAVMAPLAAPSCCASWSGCRRPSSSRS